MCHLSFLLKSPGTADTDAELESFLFFIKSLVKKMIKKVHRKSLDLFRRRNTSTSSPVIKLNTQCQTPVLDIQMLDTYVTGTYVSTALTSKLNYFAKPPKAFTRLSSSDCINLLYVVVWGLTNERYSFHVLSKSAVLPIIIIGRYFL